MKKSVIIIFIVTLLLPAFLHAEDFLGAPIIPNAEVIKKTSSRMEIKSNLSHKDIVAFYRDALKDTPDIKFRNWKNATYIEDDGRLDWHSITVSKEYDNGTEITIVKDNWTWIIGTLILRYIGVFVVLIILFAGMSISGTIISRSIQKKQTA